MKFSGTQNLILMSLRVGSSRSNFQFARDCCAEKNAVRNDIEIYVFVSDLASYEIMIRELMRALAWGWSAILKLEAASE